MVRAYVVGYCFFMNVNKRYCVLYRCCYVARYIYSYQNFNLNYLRSRSSNFPASTRPPVWIEARALRNEEHRFVLHLSHIMHHIELFLSIFASFLNNLIVFLARIGIIFLHMLVML